MPSLDSFTGSADSGELLDLTAEQEEQLSELLDLYLQSLEQGQPQEQKQLVEGHPELEAPLRRYIQKLNELQFVFSDSSGPSSRFHLASTAADDARRLGDYVLGREIGRGGMGVVYEARQISLDRRVAVKVLPFAAVLDDRQITRFQNEAQAAAQINHPNIVPVFAIGVERGVHYYAMQLIDGSPLDLAIQELRRGKRCRPRRLRADTDARFSASNEAKNGSSLSGPLDLSAEFPPSAANGLSLESSSRKPAQYFRAVARLGIQAADALHAAHDYGIVHRDIKPSNLLLDGRGKLWVTDFGLARCQQDAALTRTGDVVGTMRYMSPEQASGDTGAIDHRTDIYSLGTTLYELLTFEPAISGNDGPGLLDEIAHQSPPALRRLRPEIPADLENVILKAMAKQRDERYATAQEFAADLTRFLEGRPTEARPPTRMQRLAKWSLRHKHLVTAAAAVGLLLIMGMTVSMILITYAKRETQRNYRRAERNLQEANQAVDRFGAQLAERLATVPGAAHVRRELLEETLSYYQAFARQAEHDPALRSDLALTYSKIANLTGQIGQTDEALAAHQKALSLFQALTLAEPKKWGHKRRMAQCQNNLAVTLRRAGRPRDAIRATRAAIQLQQDLVRRSPAEPFLDDLAVSYTNLGLLLSDSGASDQAAESFQEAIRLQKQLLEDAPHDAQRHRHLAISHNNLASLYVHDQPQRAERGYRTALEHQQAAVKQKPEERLFRADLATTYSNLGALQSGLGSYADAARSFESAILLQVELTRQSPGLKKPWQDLAVSYNNYGMTLSRLRQASEAEQAFRQALLLQETLIAQFPGDAELRSCVGGIYNNLGIVLEELDRPFDALSAYESAIEHQRIAWKHAPRVLRYRDFLSKHYFNYGRVLRNLGHPDRAAEVALQRRALWPKHAEHLVAIAEELVLASQQLAKTGDSGQLTSDQCAEHAKETLQQSLSVGSTPQVFRQSEILAAVQSDERFFEAARAANQNGAHAPTRPTRSR